MSEELIQNLDNLEKTKKYWFKAKRYGWGWVPVSWEGWVTTLGFMALLIASSFVVQYFTHSDKQFVTVHITVTIILVVLLVGICYKTGERPKWRWGGDGKL